MPKKGVPKTAAPRARKSIVPQSAAPAQVAVSNPLQEIIDSFSNPFARIGQGTNSLLEGTRYPLTRLSNNYELLIALFRNNWIVRNVVQVPAADAMKNWLTISCQESPEKIDNFNRVINTTLTEAKIQETILWARLFGGAVALIVIEGHEDKLDQRLDLEDVELGSYRGLIVFDRWSGVSPMSEAGSDITKPMEFGLPQYYQIQPDQGPPYRVHASRLLRFVGPEVPRWELQAQQYWGISQIEVMFEELKKRDNVSWSIANIIFRSNVWVLRDQALNTLVTGIGMTGEAAKRGYQAYSQLSEQLSNQGIVILGEKGGIENQGSTTTGLSEVEINCMLSVCGATGIPMTRLFGRSATGLGQSNEGDEAIYDDRIQQVQKREISPQLHKLFDVVAMSAWGKVPRDLDHKWNPIRMPTNEERAELAKSKTDAIMVAFNGGVIGLQTAMKELQAIGEETGLFSNIQDSEVIKASDTPAAQQQIDQQKQMAEMGGAGGEEEPGGAPPGEPEKLEPAKKKGILQKMMAAIGKGGEKPEAEGAKGTAVVKQPRPVRNSS